MSFDTASVRNVEIKARLGDKKAFQRRIQIARKLTGSDGEIIKQRDVFFNSLKGRLKLRYLENKKSELILYYRPNVGGPKISTFHKIDLDQPEVLETILTESAGRVGEVRKQRHFYLHDRTRIHLDDVEVLGHFLEFEVVLKPEETLEDGSAVVRELMKVFEIEDEDFIVGAYMDKLLNLDK
ncbi:uncharacterized protein LOC129763277 [Toxorhynchites rutilus septentrionalis]|uniref:uncharacterized protein LOC129763277 n=1 Tax=Toxorhynchites rutilus septentrionalis TaxID=329112 RepID=UPI002479FB58|nr:uncharacterized protein LOC129763277 [Toxorhynchites rutilus septentrionalis]